jgi:uncharacterized protein (TIGR02271 family)
MARIPLSQTNDWELVNERQDIRGSKVQDVSGRPLGTVRDLIVNTDVEAVDGVILDNGRQYSTREIEIRDGIVCLLEGAGAGMARRSDREGEQRLQLVEERLRIHKRPEERGEVKLRKDVVTEQKSVEVPVSHEELVIERHPTSGEQPARGGFEGQKEIRVPLREEKVQVEKQPVVKEEVSVGKRQVQDVKHVADTVRKEQMRVEREGEADVRQEEEKEKRRRTG